MISREYVYSDSGLFSDRVPGGDYLYSRHASTSSPTPILQVQKNVGIAVQKKYTNKNKGISGQSLLWSLLTLSEDNSKITEIRISRDGAVPNALKVSKQE